MVGRGKGHTVATARTPRETWISAGLKALADGGPDAVRIESLAKSLKVTKGGFYGFFADRGALITAMLDTWERESIDDVLEQLDSTEADPRARIRLAGQLTLSGDRLPLDLAMRDWARRDEAVVGTERV